MPSFVLSDALKHVDMVSVLLGFAVTVIATWLICRLSKVLSIGHDSDQGVQKFHDTTTSRLGGVAIFLGLAVSGITVSGVTEFHNYSFWFLLAAIPVWLAGLAEDLTRRVGPTLRLVMATVSAVCLYVTLGVSVNRTDVLLIDLLLSIPGAPLCVTLLVVAGFTHSVNIVDGFHGLACGLAIIALSGIAFMAFKVGDPSLLQMCLTSLAVVFGFFIFNWPKGAIFLGDAGAYLIGFWVVELGILLSMRNPQISPLAPVVVGLVPLIETLFSMYRRNIIKNNPINQPDAMHLHSLVYRRLLYSPAKTNNSDKKTSINAKVAIYFWIPSTCLAILAVSLFESTYAQLVLIGAYLLMYNLVYSRLVRFKAQAFFCSR
jgi:UDP-N-acetylmuramyl pentapeptide phosphotransferase/UDP-N-acetylglucosamine-1-phosphate transferase